MRVISKIIEKINEFGEPIKNWIIANDDNPLLWIGILFGGVAIFLFTYSALRKEK
jgi:hypothetical protein